MEANMQRLLSTKEVSQLTSLSRSYLRIIAREGEFPKPVRLHGSRIAWWEQDIHDWMKNREVAD